MADTPLTVIGAGVVGLAVAARLSKPFPELVVLERRERHGSETSSRNSEVIHGGLTSALAIAEEVERLLV
jgi:L-2-hydroxyglutarate oxidase LhgO